MDLDYDDDCSGPLYILCEISLEWFGDKDVDTGLVYFWRLEKDQHHGGGHERYSCLEATGCS